MERGLLQQERVEAELIAARLFRFRARRGVGVFYSLVSMLPIVSLILYATTTPLLTINGAIALTLAIWFVARLCGFGRFSGMQYSLDFLKGEKDTPYDEKVGRRLSWGSPFAWFLLVEWPWFGYTVAILEGYPNLAAIFPLIVVAELVLIVRFSHSPRNQILERRVEDWAIVVGSVLIALVAVLPEAPVWTWALASPLFILCGTKSLYDAPKELALVAP